ncbi:MAG: CotH protein [Verrucomicrobiales bacterium]|nr:CotH protein [Verrucomicrobiales bacterium]
MKYLFVLLAVSTFLVAPNTRADSTVVFNEVMYHPNATNEASLEWLELHNQMAVDMDISGWSLQGGVQFNFPEGTVIGGGKYLVVAASPATLTAATGVANVVGPFIGQLSNAGALVELRNNNQRLMDSLQYGVEDEWPVAADGAGPSLVKTNRFSGSALASSWRASSQVGGTPGTANFPTTQPTTTKTNLLPISATWRYDQSGTDLGTVWTAPGFNDSAWPSGPGLLAVEDCNCLPEPIRTTLTLGRTTYYFRTAFNYAGDPSSASLQLSHVIDDGAVVYLNGVEIWRIGLAAGPVTYGTFASRLVTDGVYEGPFTVPATSLVQGTNVLAVEVHQNGATSSDITFGLALDESHTVGGMTGSSAAMLPLVLNELESATNSNFWLELFNYGSTNLSLDGFSIVRLGGAYREFALTGASVPPGGFLILPKATLGFGVGTGDKLVLYGPGKTTVLDAVVAKRTGRSRLPNGTGPWLVTTEPSPGASNVVALNNAVVVNEIMYDHTPLTATPAVYTSTNLLVAMTNLWLYNQQGLDLGTGWRQGDYNDAGWLSGRALHYVSTATLPAAKNTPLSVTNASGTRLITWYFRTPFVFTGDVASAELVLRTIIDDGAVFYLNGAEVYRQNMPAGAVAYSTFASAGVATPGLTGPVIVPTTTLVNGTNWLTAEVHQFSTNGLLFSLDVVFGAELSAKSLISPAQPTRESPESWIELYNRSSNAVSLSGWKLRDAINFDFATNQTIAAGGYLVIAKDPAFMQAQYPGLNVLGPFSKSLSHNNDQIRLDDALGNPADAVHYYSAGRWPRLAHAGGSSLELRDPQADNSTAEAWAASDESGKSTWATYTYRGVAAAETAPSPTTWKEFVLGMLDAGEVLLDDISVIDSPSGAATQLIQNGNFENGLTGWRLLGNHKGSIVTDPANPGNHVLRLVATGSTDHMHNHAEITLAGGASIVNGREYEISFRAKWQGGNNALLTRLYFNRLPRVTQLPIPALSGTPGARNSRFVANLGPTYTDFSHTPTVPSPNAAITVSVTPSDPQGVTNVTLFWSANGGTWNTAPMVAQASGAFLGTVPGQTAGTLVQFYVEGADSLGARTTFPADGANSRALFRVNDNAAIFDVLHNLRILMTPADTALLHAPTNVMSNDGLGATIVYNEEQVFYDINLHLQGSERGRNDSSRVGFTFSFQPDNLFRGVHEGMSIDRSGGYSGLGGKHDEILLKHMVMHAGGLPGMYDDLIHVMAPRAQDNSTGLLLLAKYGNVFLDSQYTNGNNGDLFKLELIYSPTTTSDGTPTGYKLPQPDDVVGVDFQDLGSDQESYRWNYLKENNQSGDRWDQMITVAKMFGLPAGSIDAPSRRLIDVNEWCRAFAIESLFGVGDSYGFGLGHNFMLYFRPSDSRALAFPWDMDFSFTQSATAPLLPSANVTKVLSLPANQRLYYSHLYDLINTTYNLTYATRWGNHFSGLLGQTWSGAINYIGARASFVLSQLPTATAFALTSNGGNDFTVTNNLVQLTGTAPIRVEFIEINGIRYPITWTSTTAWSIFVPVDAGTNLLSLQAIDRYDHVLTNVTDTIKVVNNGQVPSPLGYVVINEIHYHATNSGGSFVELHNTHPSVAFDLSNWRLEGVDFTFPEGSLILPGGFFVVASDTNVYSLTYSAAPLPGGQYNGTLQNNGEILKLLRPIATNLNEMIDAVRYSDQAPWPTNADGFGASLQVVDPTQERSRVANWAGAAPTPGATNLVRAALGAFPSLWLNELLVFNTNGVADNFAEREPWIEIFNQGGNVVNLAGLFLSDDPNTPLKWPFPAGSALAPGEFRIIWADGEPGESAGANLHTSFRLTNSSGTIILSRTNAGSVQVLDYVEYFGLTQNRAFGSWPDGQAIDRQIFLYSTPGAPNNPASAPVPVLISEFMADNAAPGGLRDPVDGLYQDWVELYNPNTNAFDLSGYFLSDTLAQPKFQIPLNTVIGAHGFLLVWADNQPEQNGLSPFGDLHAGFQLTASGEAIAIFAPDGTLQSSVVFGQQFQNVSMGLFPEGVTNGGYRYMTNFTPRAANSIASGPAAFPVTVSAVGANLTLVWPSLPGRTYRLFYKQDLSTQTWVQLQPDVSASGANATAQLPISGTTQGFYRIQLLQ